MSEKEDKKVLFTVPIHESTRRKIRLHCAGLGIYMNSWVERVVLEALRQEAEAKEEEELQEK